MDRRPLTLLLALGLAGAVPAGASAASYDALFAQSNSGTLSDDPADALTAQAEGGGTLSDEPQETKGGAESSSSKTKQDGETGIRATADALPFTGSDPRITLLLGLAAVLLGAGLRLRTAHPDDF